MRRIVFSFLLFLPLFILAQSDSSGIQLSGQHGLQDDSLTSSQAVQNDSSRQAIEIRQWSENNNRNLLGLTRQIEERQKKEKRMAMIRIGVGLLLLVVLVLGWMRKRKK